VAVSRNPENAAPISGSYEGPGNVFQGIQVDVTVVQVDRPVPAAQPVQPLNPPPRQQQQQSQRQQAPQPVQQTQQMAQQSGNSLPAMDMVIQQQPPQPAAAANPTP
jgi:hypothetical protein